MKEKDELSRRLFLTSAVAGSIGLMGVSETSAATRFELTEELLRPTPADALVDFMELAQNLEGNILRKYYQLIGRVSLDLNNKYGALKTAIIEFKKLVPEFQSKEISRIENGMSIGNLTALSLVGIAGLRDLAGVGNQAEVMQIATSEMKTVSSVLNAKRKSVTLSSEAVKLLKEIFVMIDDLNKPTKSLEKIYELLYSTSSELRGVTKEMTPLMFESVRVLVAADLIQAQVTPDSVAAVKNEMTSDGLPTSISALRSRAIRNLEKVNKIISQLGDFSIPKELLDFPKPASFDENNEKVEISDLLALLEGTKKWIGQGISNDGSVTQNRNSGAQFVKASSRVPDWPWRYLQDVYNEIYSVVAQHIPQANSDRVRTLYIRKLALNASTSRTRQEQILYNLIVELRPVEKFDLRSQRYQAKRTQVAGLLARI